MTIAETLRWRAEHQPDRRAFTFVGDDGATETQLSYGELYRRAALVAAELQRRGAAGERVLLLYPAGMEYVAAIYGCLLAGAVAVPAYPPRKNRLSSRIESIAADAQPKLVLTTTAILESLDGLAGIDRVATDDGLLGDAANASFATNRADTLAVLQYTSGSTGDPRGVMVSHANLQHNMRLIADGFGVTDDDRGMIWLPSYHDMGLLGGVLVPPYVGIPVALMSPNVFLQRPIRWLEAIARQQSTISGGPNFAYDLCVARTTEEERASIDLSSWRLAFVGAEPVRAETLDRFARAFAPAGFRRSAFYPCYGLAEATLIVSGGKGPANPVIKTVSQRELAHHRVAEVPVDLTDTRAVVSCGRAMPETTIAIVDPHTTVRCEDGGIGEIWVAGPSIARGYWNKAQETTHTFEARLQDDPDAGPFMRTGDLGALVDGELLVTGRIKDVFIINGRNHYAQDIEWTAAGSHEAVAGGAGAAFSVEIDGTERVVVVQEVRRSALKSLAANEVIGAIRAAVAREHDLPVHAVNLVKPLSVPKTSSGKTQRHACRESFLSGALESIAGWSSSATIDIRADDASPRAQQAVSASEIERWLIDHIARELAISPSEIDSRQPFAYYGLSSLQAVALSASLEAWLARALPATLAYDYPTIALLSRYLAGDTADRGQTSDSDPRNASEPIAVIGMACRFPGAPDVDAFWRLLERGVDAIGDLPDDRRALWQSYEDAATQSGAALRRRAGFIGRIDEFDPEFFGISPREAASIDPQQRLLLEVASEALADAGMAREAIRGTSTGVFVGISSNDYSRIRRDESSGADPYAGTGNALSIAANRLSYVFDLHGPSMAVDTACSSALVAVHLACQSLRNAQCDVAWAGGVNLLISPAVTASFEGMGFLAPDGRCKTFDAAADGYVRGEGAGVVILKPLNRALADGDRVYAVIRGSAVNNDGRTNGLTAPSRQAQEAVLRAAYADAGISPARATYVEAHGTGTSLGDPIELAALGAVLRDGRAPDDACLVGSVKTNIGHLEAAAGIAGLIKTVLALDHGQIPASLHFEAPNPRIPFDELPLRVQGTHGVWPERDRLRIAGVSAFGFGGTNAHVVVEKPATGARSNILPTAGAPSNRLLTLSATSADRLEALAKEFGTYLLSTTQAWDDICYTASARHSHYDCRLAVVAKTAGDASAALLMGTNGARSPKISTGRAATGGDERIVFVFTGQGAQWWAMGRELLEHDATFSESIDASDRILRRYADWSLRDALSADEATSRLHDTAIAQPAIVALQIALAACWRRWGVHPSAVVGHSVGEIAAAHVAGVLTLDDAIRIAFHRGRVMQRAAGLGCMAAVHESASFVEAAIADARLSVSIAAVNSPTQVVLAGDPVAIEHAVDVLRGRGVRCQPLTGGYAFHSSQMEPLAAELAEAIGDVRLQRATVHIVPTADGWSANSPPFGTGYWCYQMRRAVRFADALKGLADQGYRSFVELGPHSVLSGAVAESLRAQDIDGLAVPTLRRGARDTETMLESLGELYCRGLLPDWHAVQARGTVISLPKHPWRRRRLWIEDEGSRSAMVPSTTKTSNGKRPHVHPLLGGRVDVAAAATFVWQNEIGRRTQPYLEEHRFQGGELIPGTAYFEMAVAAATELFGGTSLVLENIEFRAPFFLPRDGSRTSQVVLTVVGEERASFRVFSRPTGGDPSEPWTLHALGDIARDDEVEQSASIGGAERATIQDRCTEELSGDDYFAELAGRGFEYGPAFRGLRRIWRRPGESFGRLEVPETIAADIRDYHLHPALLDAGAQLVVATDGARNRPFLPAGIESVRVRRGAGQPAWGHASYRAALSNGTQGFAGDVRLLDREGNLLVEARGLRVRYVDENAQSSHSAPDRWLYELQWHKRPRVARQDNARLDGIWLILADGSGVGEALARQITDAGGRSILTFAGDAFDALGDDRYRIRPAHADDLRRLADQVFAAGGEGRTGRRRPAGIVDLWSLDAAPSTELNVGSLRLADGLGVGSVVALLQAFAVGETPDRFALWLGTRGAHRVGDDESVIHVSQLPVWGLGRTLLQEHPGLAGGMVDLDPIGTPEQVAAALFETIARPDGETQTVVRGDARYVARLVRSTALDTTTPVHLRADASYLITGGLGGLGLALANWMIDCGARRLILLGRTQLPARAEWTTVQPGGRVAESIAAVRALEARGASIHLASIDVSDEEGLDQFITTFDSEGWPRIRGVVHAAGVVQDEVLSRVTPATLEAVSRAKVVGSWLLHRRFRDEQLDFFVLFSSAASLLGSAGQGTYAAANAFLDGLAHLRRSIGLPALSVNWGPWEQVGMAANGDVAQRLARRGIGTIPAAQGLAVLGRAMRSPVAQLGVIPIDWDALIRAVPAARTAPLFELLNEVSSGDDQRPPSGGREQLLAAPESERYSLAERLVREEVARVARLEPDGIDTHRSLDLLGIDSLMSIELKNRLERSLGISIPVVRLLEVPTVAGLATVLVEEVLQASAVGGPTIAVVNTAAAASNGTPLIALRQSGAESPLFLVHPGALDARCYSEVAHGLGDQRPCYVLQPPELENYRGLDAELPLDVSIESIAASCIEAVRGVQPRGPYQLGGWSLGGVVAFDMAQQLEAQGESVELLALFDAPSPAAGERPDDWDDAALVRLFASYLGARQGRDITLPMSDPRVEHSGDPFRRLRDHALAAQLVPADAEVDHIRSLYNAYKVGLRLGTQLLWRYRPRTYAGPITYFRAAEESTVLREVFPAAADTWASLTASPLKIHEVPGSHYTMFLSPHAETLADSLRRCF